MTTTPSAPDKAQFAGEGYDYGYSGDAAGQTYGSGGEDDLLAAMGDFDSFNREQQAQIIEHWWARQRDGMPSAEWEPYHDVVHA